MRSRILLIALLLLIVSFIITLNMFSYQSYQSEMATQINSQQLIIAKTVASSIKDTIEHIKSESVDFAGLLALRGLEKKEMDEFFKRGFTELNEDIRINTALIDKSGEVLFSTWKKESIPGYDINSFAGTDRLNSSFDDSFIRNGLLSIWAPVKKGGDVEAMLLVGINIADVNRKFLYPVKSGRGGYAWMMNGAGTLMYHPTEPEMVGRNINTDDKRCYRCHTSFNVERQILKTLSVGSSSYVAPGGEDKLVSFSWIEPMRWVVCVSIPYSEVTASIKNSMRLHSLLVISIFILTIVGAAAVIFLDRKRVSAEEKARYADKVREYADELETIVKERTEELSSEKEKLLAVVSSLEAGISILDMDSRCVWMNKVMMEWLSEENAYDFSLEKIYQADVKVSEICSAVLREKLIQDVLYIDLGKKKGYFQISLTTFHTPDGSCRLLLLLQDVTELRKAEDKLIQSEKLSALARLSAGVAHEIGNPLTSISSYVQILQGRENDKFSSEALETISKHIKRISAIVKEMSDFSKTRAGETGRFNVSELVESTVELVRYDRRTKKIKIEISMSKDLPQVEVDGNQMVQVFMNLIFNAADAMMDGGLLKIIGHMEDGFAEVDFVDTGHGIEKENLDRIFDPFFTTKSSGTGLGLSVSYSIIKSFGGDILVESKPGEGSVFRVRVPIHEKREI